MNCPACRAKCVEQGFEASLGGRVLLDVCPSCHGLWFDARESVQLSSEGVLKLFRQMHGRKDEHHRVKEPLGCPRCRERLVRTHDLARGNRFQYFRCPSDHGHFITFFQFLREKGIVRSLNAAELAELKKHVQHIQCSDCGDPISLAEESACPRCRAPVCVLDPKALGSVIEELRPTARAGAVVAPAMAAQILMEQMKVDNFHRKVTAEVAAASASSLPLMDTQDIDKAARFTDTVENVSLGLDLLEVGIDFFLDIVGGIGDLF